ncbi:MAG: Fe(3+)-hydroxamate ABC transporter permease FhuB [Vitreoscilla sp.]|nr:Fe(3+)-hydroxamate ABC transporter permease FhuB [Vitreoscilla sp.]
MVTLARLSHLSKPWLLLGSLSLCCCLSLIVLWQQHGGMPVQTWLLPADSLSLEALVIQANVLPRLAMAMLAGGVLAVCGVLLQQLTRNSLAADNTLAISSGAQIALLVVTLFFPNLLLWRADVWAFLGALCSMALVLTLAYKNGLNPVRMILAGLILNLYLGSFSMTLMLFYSEEARSIMQWSSGSLVQDGWQDVQGLAVRALLAFVAIAVLAKPLSMLGLGDEQAQSLGVPVMPLRLGGLLIAAFLSASVVSMVGMLGFAGLAAAAASKHIGLRTFPAQAMAAFFIGALLLLLTDSVLQNIELQTGWLLSTGAITAFIGAPLLLWLIFRSLPNPLVQNHKEYAHIAPFSRPTIVIMMVLAVAVLLISLWVAQDANGWHVNLNWDAWLLRYPRLLMAAAAGIMLATAGVILQRMTLNPLASPELLGISAGTAAGVFVAVLLGISAGVQVWLCGIAAAITTLAAILFVNRNSGLQPERILLTGMAIAALFDALINVFLAAGDPRAQAVLVWLSGSTYQATPFLANTLIVLAVCLLILSLPLARCLGLLSLGSPMAQALGLNVALTQKGLVVLAAILTALSTLMLGPMCFVGLWAPHLAKFLGFHKPLHQLLAAAAIAVIAMVFADWLGRQIVYPYEIPAGLMATLLGGAYFFRLMRKI